MYRIHHSGFSLVELLMVVVVLGLCSVALVRLFGQMGGTLEINRDLQAAAQLAQECAEHLLSAKRSYGFAMGGVSDCATSTVDVTALTAFNGNGPPTVTMINPFTGSSCPATALCKSFAISADYNGSKSSLVLMVADY